MGEQASAEVYLGIVLQAVTKPYMNRCVCDVHQRDYCEEQVTPVRAPDVPELVDFLCQLWGTIPRTTSAETRSPVFSRRHYMAHYQFGEEVENVTARVQLLPTRTLGNLGMPIEPLLEGLPGGSSIFQGTITACSSRPRLNQHT